MISDKVRVTALKLGLLSKKQQVNGRRESGTIKDYEQKKYKQKKAKEKTLFVQPG